MTDTPANRPVLLITGASTGIGAETARLAADRYDLALHYNTSRDATEEVAEACRARGARAVPLQANLEDPTQVAELFEQFDAAFDRLDALANNAGIVDQAARVADFTPERVNRMVTVNLVAPILVAGQAVRRMGKGGAIVNVSSAAARHGSAAQYVDYAATKGGLEVFSKGLAQEVAAQGIRVTAVRPGIIATPIHAKGGQPDRVAEMAKVLPMGRAGTPEEVARAILWLLSDEASYVTDSILDVSGGR